MPAPIRIPYTLQDVQEVPVLVQKNGACASRPDVDFFGETKVEIQVAKSVCAACPVSQLCLNYAVNNEEYGVWGGYTPKERAQMRTTKFVSQEDRRSAALLRERINQGIKNVDLAREFGVTERTIYRWKSKYEEDLKELNREAA